MVSEDWICTENILDRIHSSNREQWFFPLAAWSYQVGSYLGHTPIKICNQLGRCARDTGVFAVRKSLSFCRPASFHGDGCLFTWRRLTSGYLEDSQGETTPSVKVPQIRGSYQGVSYKYLILNHILQVFSTISILYLYECYVINSACMRLQYKHTIQILLYWSCISIHIHTIPSVCAFIERYDIYIYAFTAQILSTLHIR